MSDDESGDIQTCKHGLVAWGRYQSCCTSDARKRTQVQEGVLPAVLAAASVNPAQFLNIVKECRSKHRVTTYCDEAIARASQLAKFAAGDL